MRGNKFSREDRWSTYLLVRGQKHTGKRDIPWKFILNNIYVIIGFPMFYQRYVMGNRGNMFFNLWFPGLFFGYTIPCELTEHQTDGETVYRIVVFVMRDWYCSKNVPVNSKLWINCVCVCVHMSSYLLLIGLNKDQQQGAAAEAWSRKWETHSRGYWFHAGTKVKEGRKGAGMKGRDLWP